jgi:GTP cyclohydrolase II
MSAASTLTPFKPLASLEVMAQACLPTRFGTFVVYSFRRGDRVIDDVAIAKGDLEAFDRSEPLTTRIHSECLTGDAFGSTRCDCRDQLEMALAHMDESGLGLLLYLRQEGRGIGIANKIGAYQLQDEGLDTVQANLRLGYEDDMRTYEVAAGMLRALGVPKVDLCTNNPRKVSGLESYGVEVVRRVPIVAKPRPENVRYLQTKRVKSGHLY